MFLERGMNLGKTLRGHFLAQEFFTTLVSNPIKNATAQRRTNRSHHHVEEERRRFFIHISSDHQIHGKTDGSGIHGGDDQYSPWTHRRQDFPEKSGVLGEDVFYGFQKEILTNEFCM